MAAAEAERAPRRGTPDAPDPVERSRRGDVFKDLKMAYPEPTAKRRRELQVIRQTLVK